VSSPKDSFGAIARDALATVRSRAKAAAAVATPHLTLDNAIKVATVVNLLATARPHPTPPPPPAKKGDR